jgi:hypothetical protein
MKTRKRKRELEAINTKVHNDINNDTNNEIDEDHVSAKFIEEINNLRYANQQKDVIIERLRKELALFRKLDSLVKDETKTSLFKIGIDILNGFDQSSEKTATCLSKRSSVTMPMLTKIELQKSIDAGMNRSKISRQLVREIFTPFIATWENVNAKTLCILYRDEFKVAFGQYINFNEQLY